MGVKKVLAILTNKAKELSKFSYNLWKMKRAIKLSQDVIRKSKYQKVVADMPGITCLENTLGIIQLAIQWFTFMLILILFMLYFPSHRKLAPYIRHLHFNIPPTRWSIEWRNSIVVAIIITIHFIITLTITGILLLFYGHEDINWMKGWADFLGVSSMIFVSIQFIPQLYRTWWRKSVGALSIPMMFMQVPASFIFVYTLYIRPGTRWTTWIVFFVSGCLQGILLIMCICWYFRSKRLGHGPFYVSETDQLLGRNGKPLLPDERTRLINKGQKKRSPRPSTSRGSSYNSNTSDLPPTKDHSLNIDNDPSYLAVSS
ncbi:6455_t:CDS:2 [Funneliformis caledonium]|uniref:6455_t:CDS:1 n=1 Tax=Funneliformis caledonium TaxID=1117310 RepID=A0A9N9FR75_9GLOM|nr:6455_t:CDS:2 [Funneliformis caledonium]